MQRLTFSEVIFKQLVELYIKHAQKSILLDIDFYTNWYKNQGMLSKLISAPKSPRRRVALSSSKRAHISAVEIRSIEENWRYECRHYAFGHAVRACRKNDFSQALPPVSFLGLTNG